MRRRSRCGQSYSVALVAFDATGVAAVGALTVAVELAAGVELAAELAATVPAMPTNDTMLSPPSNHRVAAAG